MDNDNNFVINIKKNEEYNNNFLDNDSTEDENEDENVMENQMIIQNLYNIVNIYKDADKLIKYLNNCNFFYSPILMKWVKDYYKVQTHLAEFKLRFNKELDVPVPCSLFVWTNKDIQCQVKFDFLGRHVGIINLNPGFTYIYYRLKIFKEINPELYKEILPTKFDIYYDDDNKLIFLTAPENEETFNVKDMKNHTLRKCNINSSLQGTKEYIDTCKYYYGFDDFVTELNYMAESLYGYITLLIRTGIDFKSLGDFNNYKEIRIGDVSVYNGIESVVDMEDHDTGFTKISTYSPDKYNFHSNEKRALHFKDYGDNTINMFIIDKEDPKNVSQEFITSYEDIKRLIVSIFFGTDKENLNKYSNTHRDENGLFTQFESIGEILHSCQAYADNKKFVYDPNKSYQIHNVVVKDIFYNAFNDKHNLLVKSNVIRFKPEDSSSNDPFIDYTKLGNFVNKSKKKNKASKENNTD